MALFDVLKYGGTDFTNREEVLALPIPVVDSVWAELYNNETYRSYNYKVSHLVQCSSVLYTKWLKEALHDALREYNELV